MLRNEHGARTSRKLVLARHDVDLVYISSVLGSRVEHSWPRHFGVQRDVGGVAWLQPIGAHSKALCHVYTWQGRCFAWPLWLNLYKASCCLLGLFLEVKIHRVWLDFIHLKLSDLDFVSNRQWGIFGLV